MHTHVHTKKKRTQEWLRRDDVSYSPVGNELVRYTPPEEHQSTRKKKEGEKEKTEMSWSGTLLLRNTKAHEKKMGERKKKTEMSWSGIFRLGNGVLGQIHC